MILHPAFLFGGAILFGLFGALLAALRPLVLAGLISGEAFVDLPVEIGSRNIFAVLLIGLEVIDTACLIISGILLAHYSTGHVRQLREKSVEITLDGIARGDDEIINSFVSRMKTCSEVVEDFLRNALVPSICAVATLVGSVFFSFKVASSVSILVALEAVFLFGVTILYGSVYQRLAKDKLDTDAKFLADVDLNRSKAIAVLYSGFQSVWKSGRIRDIKAVELSRRRVANAEVLYFNFVSFFLGAYLCLGYFVIIYVQDLPISTFIAFVFYAGLMMAPITRISSFLPELKNFILARDSLRLDPSSVGGGFVFKNLSFRFKFGGVLVSGVRDRILLRGQSGSGKTSLLLQIIGFSHGDVLVDDIPSSSLTRRANDLGIFYLSEMAVFEKGTVDKSLLCGLERLLSCNSRFSLFDEARLLELLNLEVGQTGLPLSLGERQRFQLLRVLCQKPSVLLMDEALSGLEEQLEERILDALFASEDLRVLIYVSHRSVVQSRFAQVIDLDGSRLSVQ
jgi:ABC-type bacteriocin/lantibiotic exporter with double-glycine peptidase domain